MHINKLPVLTEGNVKFVSVFVFNQEMAVMKQVVLNLSQPQYSAIDRTTQPGPRATVKKVSGVKNQPTAPRPNVTFEQAERDENVYKPQPTEFVSVCDMALCWLE